MLYPGERPKRLTENQKKYLIRIGPYQPILQRYPTKPSNTNSTNESRKQSRFNPSWFKEYPHLEYSLSKDAAFCFVVRGHGIIVFRGHGSDEISTRS